MGENNSKKLKFMKLKLFKKLRDIGGHGTSNENTRALVICV